MKSIKNQQPPRGLVAADFGRISPWDSIPVLALYAPSKHSYCSNISAKCQLAVGRYAPARIRTEISSLDGAALYPLSYGGIPHKFSTAAGNAQTGGKHG